MGVIVIVAYRPHPGKEAELAALVAEHVPVLRAAGLATARAPVIAKAADGTVVEVFEWVSEKAVELAHANEAVRALWERFELVCDYVPVGELPEASGLFSSFTPVDL
jgi:quinol monooxygenase YgiN